MNDLDLGIGLAASTLSEDVIKLKLLFNEDQIVDKVEYKIFGRLSSIKAAKQLPLLIEGLGLEQILSLAPKEINYDDIVYGQLIVNAIRNAISNYYNGDEIENI